MSTGLTAVVDSHLQVAWAAGVFEDPEQPLGMDLELTYRIGERERGEGERERERGGGEGERERERCTAYLKERGVT